ncbi:hypothetical protein AHiyo8_26260 [Arthrobacter sp. Hiyo8]|nr:hypothetical protein AHiyo8_26260 [Arthrobacter sp. Hiyo8]
MNPAHTTEILQGFMDSTVNGQGKSTSAPPVVETRDSTTLQSFPAILGKFTYTDADGRRLNAQILTVMHGSTLIQALAISGSSPMPSLMPDKRPSWTHSTSWTDPHPVHRCATLLTPVAAGQGVTMSAVWTAFRRHRPVVRL